jgi:hypothetical protein
VGLVPASIERAVSQRRASLFVDCDLKTSSTPLHSKLVEGVLELMEAITTLGQSCFRNSSFPV